MGEVKRAKHAVYDLKYHFVWVPKYRKLILQGEVAEGLKEVFEGIAERYGLEIDVMEVMGDHVHVSPQSERSGTDSQECLCAGGISTISRSERAAVGRGVVERRVFCTIGWG